MFYKIYYLVDHPYLGARLWTFNTPGPISYSAAATTAGVFVGSEEHLYALAPADGSLLWEFTSNETITTAPSATSAVVYFGAGDNLLAVRTSDGTAAWADSVVADGDISAAPVVSQDGSRLYFGR